MLAKKEQAKKSEGKMGNNNSAKECARCSKSVDVVEEVVAAGKSFHKDCFRCKECNSALTVQSASSHQGEE